MNDKAIINNRRLFRTLSFLLCLSFQRVEALELKLAHVGEPGSIHDQGAQEFARRANARLDERTRVVVYPSAVLGGDMDLIAKVKTGEIAFSIPSSVMTSVDDRFGIFDMPFIFQNRHHVRAVRDILLDRYLRPAVEEKGLRLLAMWEIGYRHMTNSVRPIEKPSDLNGLKLRVPKGLWRQKMFQSYGATVFQTNLDEVYAKLETKELDGQETPAPIIKSLNLNRVQKYLTLSYHVYTPAFLLTSQATFNALPAEVTAVVEETAAEVQDWILDKAAKSDASLIADLSRTMTVNEIDTLAFTMSSLPIYKEFARNTTEGRIILKTVLDATPWTEPRGF